MEELHLENRIIIVTIGVTPTILDKHLKYRQSRQRIYRK